MSARTAGNGKGGGGAPRLLSFLYNSTPSALIPWSPCASCTNSHSRLSELAATHPSSTATFDRTIVSFRPALKSLTPFTCSASHTQWVRTPAMLGGGPAPPWPAHGLTQTTGKIGHCTPMSPPDVASSQASYRPVSERILCAPGTTIGMAATMRAAAQPPGRRHFVLHARRPEGKIANYTCRSEVRYH